MSDEPKTQTGAAQPIDLDLRTRNTTAPLTPDMKRFNIFLVDTGWNRPISRVVRSHVRGLFEIGGYHVHDSLYELTPQQSVEVLKHDPQWIGCDPTIIVYDLYGCSRAGAGNYCGFRLNLGLMKHRDQALARLQEFVRFIAINRTAERLDQEVRRELHREGIEGIVKILRETSVDLLME
jgi:hypothetical protein